MWSGYHQIERMAVISPVDKFKDHYDVVIVGGGIVGAGIFRDLSLHNVDCLLIDKNDFTSQTSQSSSKMLHGGIRYLENLDFELVHEALHEKNLWLHIAPHLCYDQSFHFPVFKNSPKPLWMIRIGLFLYDFLSGFKNVPHKILSPKEVKKKFPTIKTDLLTGVGVYHDVVVDDSKLTLEVIYDGLVSKNSMVGNYIELKEFKNFGENTRLHVSDTLIPGKEKIITAKNVVFALGPFTDQFFQGQKGFSWTSKLLPTKGSHIWLKRDAIDLNDPVVLTTPDNRIIFTIPRKEAILVGTTEISTTEDFFNLKPTEKEIDYLIDSVNEYFPGKKISKDDVLSSYAGIRPLVREDSAADAHKTARVHKIYRPYPGAYVIIGGKYTTFRVMGQEICRNIVQKLGGSYNQNKTLSTLRRPSKILSFRPCKMKVALLNKEKLEEIINTEHVRTFSDLIHRRIGIPNKNHWIDSGNFKDFFMPYYEFLKERIKISKDDIENF